ncbi:MAG TPA: hypothetical protein VGV41_01550 [Pseudolabrys sp.]|uniref:hypothetical protein n=1 Tax=Pseudolabrys sp. TaxID=1960880 RepID=UPI002DDD4976|nr:hypothetical protein [Pseudolabrys sp.]HEV2627316.1 hypothetical protein [Pseudolabrys sp.]
MPTRYPMKARVKTKAVEAEQAVDWLALWAMSLAFASMVLAAIAYFTIGDKLGASAILAGAALIIGLALQASKPPAHE